MMIMCFCCITWFAVRYLQFLSTILCIRLNYSILLCGYILLCVFCERTTHEFLFGALAELLDNARFALFLSAYVIVVISATYIPQ